MPDDARISSKEVAIPSNYSDIMKMVESDHLLAAVEAAKSSTVLTVEERQRILDLAAYTTSTEAYQAYYRDTTRGGICLEGDLFSKHFSVKRFAGIRERILARKQMRVLDLGCLDGWCLLNLAAGGVTGIGVDLNRQALQVAQARVQKYGFSLIFVESAIEDFSAQDNYPGDSVLGMDEDTHPSLTDCGLGKFDAVILSEVLEHVLDPAKCIRVAARHLAPGGMLYISAPVTPIPHFGKMEDAVLHLRVLTEGELREMARQVGLVVTVDCEILEVEDQGQKFAHLMISFRRARVAIHTNHITGGWDPTDKASLNGSEEAVVRVAEQWAADGHEVTVLMNHRDEIPAPRPRWAFRRGTAEPGIITYRPREAALPDDLDYLVLFKNLDRIGHPARAKVYWTIDLPESAGGGAAYLPPAVAEQLDAVVCVSEWHRQRVLEACPWVPPGKVVQHWLGIDPEEIRQAREAVPEPVPHRAVYASSLDRGAIDLLRLWPRVRERVPDAELRVLYGLEFWKRSEAILQEPARSQMVANRQELERLLQQEGVTFVGRPATREEYLREIASASVWAYPCNGGELCCKVALEMQALGVFPVVIPTMALSETVMGGLKANTLEQFEQHLISTLGPSPDYSKSGLTIPTWQDLSAFLWKLAQEKLRGAVGNADVAKVPQATKEDEPLPERFAIPAPSPAMPKVSLDIIFHVNGMPFDGTTDKLKSLGGSETAGLQLARAIAKRGHHMTVFSNCDTAKKIDGVVYIPLGEFPRYVGCTPHDVCVIQRAPVVFNMPIASKLNVLWMHDLGLLRYAGQTRSSLWNVDYVVPVSHWHGRQLCQVYGLDPEIVAPMRNGIECEWIRPRSAPRSRNRKALVYAARPERGLDLLLEKVLPKLLERDSQITLSVAGYDNTVPEMQDFYNYCNSLCERYSPRVRRMGALKKPDLYSLYRNSGCLHGDSLIDMPRDYQKYPNGVPIRELVGKSDFPVYCYDGKNHRITLGTVRGVQKTRENAVIYALTLDNGSVLRGTGDHRILLRDETWRRLDALRPGDSLMPLYKRPYILVNRNNGTSIHEHRLVAEWKLGRQTTTKEHADHVNENAWDNGPENIQLLSDAEHARKTSKKIWSRQTPRQRAKRLKAFNCLTPEQRHRAGVISQAKRSPEERTEIGRRAGRASWANAENREERARQLAKRVRSWWKNLSVEERETFGHRISYGQRSRWGKLGPNQKNVIMDKVRAGIDPERRIKNCRSSAYKFWGSLPPEARAAFIERRRNGIQENYDRKRREGTYTAFMQEKAKKISAAKQQRKLLNHTVIGVRPCGRADVYDMEVKEHHSFVAEGIVVHNCYVYPTRGFEEVNCLSLAEAAAAGLPFVASAWGALPETASYCPGAVHLVPFRGGADDQYVTEFVDAVWKIISDPDVQDRMSAAGVTGAKVYDWELVAAEWEAFLLGALEMRGRDRVRTAKHFWRIGDVYGAQELVADLPDTGDSVPQIKQIHDANLPPDTGPGELPQSVLDAIGNSLGPKKPKGVLPLGGQSEPFAQQIAVPLGAKVVMDELADAVLGIETLDCSPDPGKHIREAEAYCRPGGMVCLVTAGPAVQAERLFLGGPRLGRWVFDQHDIRELLGRKPDLLALVVGGGRASQYDGTPLSWSVYSWKAGSGPTGAIDHARRKVLQSPRLSLSAAMITYNAEGMLHRCLGSFMPYVDELVVCDQGSTDSTRRILSQYGAEIVEGINPVTHGFDEARNVGLPHVTGDLILWIDSDEELLEAFNLSKYLRWNMFNGYALRQHHFSAVPENAFKPDLPVRVFRRTNLDGTPTGVRFWGCVAGDTPVDTPGGKVLIKDLVGKQPWVYAYDTKKKRRVLARADWVRRTQKGVEMLAIQLDDGTVIKTTPDHLFLVKKSRISPSCRYVEAQHLKPGNRLVAFYRYFHGGYNYLGLRSACQQVSESRFVYESVFGPLPPHVAIHHEDGNRQNNDPSNLIIMTRGDHTRHHHLGAKRSEETHRRISENHAPCGGLNNSMWGRQHSVETRAKIRAKSRERNAGYGNSSRSWFTSERASEMNRRTWADPEVHARRSAGIRAAKAMAGTNHKITAVWPAGREDAYNMEVPGPQNFVAGGVILHNCVHEHPEIEINQSVGESICLSDVHISHVGYLTESVRRRRFDRNIQLMFRDRAKYPQRNLGKLLMIRDWCHLARYTSQQAGGRMTPEVVGYYETAVKMYQDEFLGQVHTMAVDGLAYYNEALSALRRGFEVNLVLQVGWVDNTTRDVNYRGRVASVKDLQILLERSSRELASVWEGKYI